MRIRTYTFVTLDGYVSTPDGRPVQGGGLPLSPTGIEPLSLSLQSTRTFPDGVIEACYLPKHAD